MSARAPATAAVTPRARPDHWLVAAGRVSLRGIGRRWLLGLNTGVALLLVGAVLAPLLAAVGAGTLAEPLYELYRGLCHQWAFRSFFLFGTPGLTVYSQSTIEALGVDPFRFRGTPDLGWEMAFCERDLAILIGLLLFGGLYAQRWRRSGLRPSSYWLYAILVAPMALDGFTQLLGWRESTWALRLATGLLCGLASAWLLYPRFDDIAFPERTG